MRKIREVLRLKFEADLCGAQRAATTTAPGLASWTVMRQEHRAGEKLFVDYAGQTVPVIDRHSCRTGWVPTLAALASSAAWRRRISLPCQRREGRHYPRGRRELAAGHRAIADRSR